MSKLMLQVCLFLISYIKNPILISQPIHISNHKTGFHFDSPSHGQASYDFAIPCAEHLAFLQQENERLRASMDDSAAASAKKNSFCDYQDDAKPCADDRKPAPKVVDDRKPALYKEQLATEDGKAAGGTAYQAKQKPLAKSDARNPIGVLEDGKPYAVPDNGMPFAAVLHHEHPHETMAAPSAATPKRDSFHGYDYDAMAAGDDRKPAAKPVSEDGKPAEEDRKPAAYNGHSKPVLDDVKLAEDNRKPAAYNGLPPSQDPTSFDYAIPNAEHLAFLQQENERLRASIIAVGPFR